MKYKEFVFHRVRHGSRKVLSTSHGEKGCLGPNRSQEPPEGKEGEGGQGGSRGPGHTSRVQSAGLGQGVAHVSWKKPQTNQLRLCGPCGLRHSYSLLFSQHRAAKDNTEMSGCGRFPEDGIYKQPMGHSRPTPELGERDTEGEDTEGPNKGNTPRKEAALFPFHG